MLLAKIKINFIQLFFIMPSTKFHRCRTAERSTEKMPARVKV